MKHEDLDKWAVPHDKLPPQLFFVHHAGSQCRFVDRYEGKEGECPDDLSMSGGITAASPDGIFGCIDNITNVTQIYRKIQRHLDWSNSRASCFVSTFDNDLDALRWTLQIEGTSKIYAIDTSLVMLLPKPPVHIFRPADFNVKWPQNEYLFFHQIPHRAIEKISVYDPRLKRRLRIPFSTIDYSNPLPLPQSVKTKREEAAVSSRKARPRTNAGKAVVPAKKSGDGEK